MKIHSYLTFENETEEALRFYERILWGKMIMGSDMLPRMGPRRVDGNNFSLSDPAARQQ